MQLYLGVTFLILPGKSWILKILTQINVSTKDILMWIVIYAPSPKEGILGILFTAKF